MDPYRLWPIGTLVEVDVNNYIFCGKVSGYGTFHEDGEVRVVIIVSINPSFVVDNGAMWFKDIVVAPENIIDPLA